jgi:hypothetical protein
MLGDIAPTATRPDGRRLRVDGRHASRSGKPLVSAPASAADLEAVFDAMTRLFYQRANRWSYGTEKTTGMILRVLPLRMSFLLSGATCMNRASLIALSPNP